MLCCVVWHLRRSHASLVVATIFTLGPVMGELHKHMCTRAHTHTHTHVRTLAGSPVHTAPFSQIHHLPHPPSLPPSLPHCRMVLYYLVSEQKTPLKKLVYRHKLEAQKQITAVSHSDLCQSDTCQSDMGQSDMGLLRLCTSRLLTPFCLYVRTYVRMFNF